MRQVLTVTIGNSTTTYAMDFFYDASGYPFAVKYNGDLCYYITNLQGDVMSIVDAQGEVVAEYEYDPYGNILTATGPLADVNPLRYRGYVFDSESGLYYLQSRYYDPEMGRFINADALVSTGQGVLGNNMFVYCLNNPTCLMDSSGLTPTEAVDTDGDGIVDYYRYEYTYSYVYYENDTIKSVIITGNVYYFPDIGSPKNLDASDYPKGFQPWSDIMVGNYIQVKADHSNPVLYAYQAQHLHVQAYSNAIACMLQIDADFGLGLNRSKTSMMTEWLSHMVLLGKLGLSRTANVDFDRDSEDLRFLDYLKWAIQETLKIGTGK